MEASIPDQHTSEWWIRFPPSSFPNCSPSLWAIIHQTIDRTMQPWNALHTHWYVPAAIRPGVVISASDGTLPQTYLLGNGAGASCEAVRQGCSEDAPHDLTKYPQGQHPPEHQQHHGRLDVDDPLQNLGSAAGSRGGGV